LEKERTFEDLRFTNYLTNSEGGAIDLKVGGTEYLRAKREFFFSFDPHLWHSGGTQIE